MRTGFSGSIFIFEPSVLKKSMLKLLKFALALSLLIAVQGLLSFTSGVENPVNSAESRRVGLNTSVMYASLDLQEQGLSYAAFSSALKGMKRLTELGRLSQTHIISIADLSQSSTKKRLYVIDLVKQEIIYQTYVAHGRNSGEEFANVFSNQPSSYMSSLGFYTTGETYTGQHGLSLRLIGEEPGFNNKAMERAIVIHGADYVKEDFIEQNGRLGRSQGCPALPVEQCPAIIETVKNGSCLFVYAPDKRYLSSSLLLKE